MWRVLHQLVPYDFVIAIGETHTVWELWQLAFDRVGLHLQDHLVVDPALMRPTEMDLLQGPASKAKRVLGSTPKVRFRELVGMMVDADLEKLTRASWVCKHGGPLSGIQV